MKFLVTSAQMKLAEQNSNRLGVSYRQLMENAGAAAYQAIKERIEVHESLPVLLLCGSGNNGGDGFVIARKLEELGLSPRVVLCCGEPHTDDARFMYDRMEDVPVLRYPEQAGEVLRLVECAAVIVDAVYGTGFHGSLDKPLAELFWRCGRTGAIRFAVDIPSGVAADSGQADDFSFRAGYTLAMDACKPAHLKGEAKPFLGEVVTLDIGMAEGSYQGVEAVRIIDGEFVKETLPTRQTDDHKGVYGKLLNICGCFSMSGAAVMSVLSALRAGAGLVTLAAPKSVVAGVSGRILEGTFLPLPEVDEDGIPGSAASSAAPLVLDRLKSCTAGLIGCGLSLTPDTRELVSQVVRYSPCPLVVDADGLNAVSGELSLLREAQSPLVLTPHFGEMARLSGKSIQELKADKMAGAREFAKEYGVTLVLKGPNTVVAAPDGRLFVNTTGNPGMARGGSGDILAGIIAAFLAQGLAPWDAAACGVYLHGLAGDIAAEQNTMQGMRPSDMIGFLPQAFRQSGIQ